MRIITCDCKVYDDLEINEANEEKIMGIKMRGGGGTDHRFMHDYILERYPNTKLVLSFSDGCTFFPNEEKIRTIWALVGNHIPASRVPFGSVIEVD